MGVKAIGSAVPAVSKKSDKSTVDSEEAALAKFVGELVSLHKDIAEELADLLKADPLPDDIKAELNRQKKINESSRAPELKDLGKALKGKSLRSNPSKISRLKDDLNDDAKALNAMPARLKAARDAIGADALSALQRDIEKLAGSAGVSPQRILLKERLAALGKTLSAKDWKGLDAALSKLEALLKTEVAEEARLMTLAVVNEEFRKSLRFAERERLWKEAQADKAATPQKLRTALEAALDKQHKPDKSRWAKYLDLGAGGDYTLKDGGAFGGIKIHVTMSKDSWTPEADGKVDLMSGTPDAVLRKLLDHTEGGKQMHATLETNKPNYPHVFLFAGVLKGDYKWNAAREALGRDPKSKWVEEAQKALNDVLDKVKDRLQKKIAEAQKEHGANVY